MFSIFQQRQKINLLDPQVVVSFIESNCQRLNNKRIKSHISQICMVYMISQISSNLRHVDRKEHEGNFHQTVFLPTIPKIQIYLTFFTTFATSVLPECHKQGYKPKHFCSFRSQHCFVIVPHSQNGNAALDSDGQLSMIMSITCLQNFGHPNQRNLALCLVGSQQTYFQLRAAFLSLAPSSAKGYYRYVAVKC